MSTYSNYNYVSAEPLYAEIKETLKSYFDSGAIDDLMFPIWADRCIQKFRRSLFKIEETSLQISNYESALPDDFKFVRELWLCTNVKQYVQSPNAYYYQKDCRVTKVDDKCAPCFDENDKPVPILPCPATTCDPCQDNYIVTHKITNHAILSYNFKYLLKPGNISVRSHCASDCSNFNCNSYETFDIRDCKLITNFANGYVHLTYYSDNYNAEQELQIPDNVRMQEYIRLYIMYKIFETLSHQATDESARQIDNKMMYYKQLSDEAYVIADIETKKKDIYSKIKGIVKTKNRYNQFNIR